jgi:predicted AAA+ superfamily ATPase
VHKELETFLIYGTYPEIVNTHSFQDKQVGLKNLSGSYLYKDILEFQQVKDSDFLRRLLKALALQLGSEVSYTELSRLLEIDKKTIARYIDLLEKNFIIFRLPPFFTNRRKEISKLKKIYFYDVGIRNSIINNFNGFDSRLDKGALWENLAIIERMKYQEYHQIFANNYFWRTYSGTEVDWVEEREGKIYGYEIKWKKRDSAPPFNWSSPEYRVITPLDMKGFIL